MFPLGSSTGGYRGLLVIDSLQPAIFRPYLHGVSMVLLAGSLLTYMLLLSVLATASPGIGLLGWILLLLPGQLLDWLHAPAYGFLAWLSMIGLYGASLATPLCARRRFLLCLDVWALDGNAPGFGTGARS